MKLSDIKNYYYDGGVLFLVVEIIDTQNTKIFYKFLLPIELKRIMEEIKYNIDHKNDENKENGTT